MKKIFLVIYQLISPFVLIPFLIVSYIKPWKNGRLDFLKSFIIPVRIFRLFSSADERAKDSVLFHAVSLGEAKVAFTIFRGLGATEREIVLTTGPSVTTHHVDAHSKVPVNHFYAPIDFPIYWYMLIRALRVKRIVIVEHDIWPGLLVVARLMGVQVWLVNANVSERSLGTYRRNALTTSFVRFVFDCFSRVFVQHASLERSLISLGIPQEKISVSGSLKFLSVEITGTQALERGDTVCFGSCHPEESAFITQSIALIRKQRPSTMFVVVPRHPQAAPQICRSLEREFGPIALVNHWDCKSLTKGSQIVVVAAIGTLLNCYQSSAISVVCGSFSTEYGGHNLLEPFTFGSVGLYGPSIGAQKDLDSFLVENEIYVKVESETQLADRVTSLLANYAERADIIGAFRRGLEQKKGEVLLSLRTIREFVNE